jgi:hypothetical protein
VWQEKVRVNGIGGLTRVDTGFDGGSLDLCWPTYWAIGDMQQKIAPVFRM